MIVNNALVCLFRNGAFNTLTLMNGTTVTYALTDNAEYSTYTPMLFSNPYTIATTSTTGKYVAGYSNENYPSTYRNQSVTPGTDYPGYLGKWCRLRYQGLMLGRGETPPTLEDYCLEDLIPSSDPGDDTGYLTFTCRSTISNSNGHTYNETWQNPSDVDITVTEVGLFGIASNYSNGISSTYANSPYLIIREVLLEPITIPAGESRVISLNCDYSKILEGQSS